MSIIREMPEGTQAEKNAKAELLARARAVGLDEQSTKQEVVKAENDKK